MCPTRVIRLSPGVDRVSGALLLGVDDHRAQLEELEVLSVLPNARLTEENRTAVLELDRDRGRSEERARHGKAEAGDHDVGEPVHRRPSAASQVAGTPRRT